MDRSESRKARRIDNQPKELTEGDEKMFFRNFYPALQAALSKEDDRYNRRDEGAAYDAGHCSIECAKPEGVRVIEAN